MNGSAFWRGGGFEVTDSLLRTPRKTYALGQVEYVEVQRPLLFFAGLPALGMIGLCASFWRYLLVLEILSLLCVAAGAIAAALHFGTLKVHSLALRDDDVAMSFGPIVRLREVRAAVEQAMAARAGQGTGE